MGALSISLIQPMLHAEEAETLSEVAPQQLDVNDVSISFGHMIKKNIESLGLDFDVNLVMKGIEDALAGVEPPMNEEETVRAIALHQEEAFHKHSKINLQLAEEFLTANRMNDDIIELEDGKVQYCIEQNGNGDVVTDESSPTIRYSGEFIDGNIFASSEEEEVITLSETIPGLAKAIVGMREGEKRVAYIHPELAYGESAAGYLPPNAMLTFHIEVVKADTPMLDTEDLPVDQSFEELALDQMEAGALR